MSDPRRHYDVRLDDAAEAITDLLIALGYDPDADPSLLDTPMRVARAWAELLDADTGDTARAFDAEGMDEMVVLRGITGWSMCEHHLLPFSYIASVAYIPSGKVLGLSKLARVVRRYGAALQLQERMTEQVADELERVTSASGVGVTIRGVHLCAVMRGVKSEQSEFVTTVLRGGMKSSPEVRAEFLRAAAP